MTMSENANLVEFLLEIGWSSDQVTNYLLVIEGRRSIADGAKKHRELEEQK
ncbi:MAG: hypothetical protein IJ075_06270 [Lachnospiraceae bacterium]|nr:hypothetical protein [Lachnospiraceae bacterium]MBQ9607659.1 hypothetical protein [Lachnospiraceae bacterium]MBR1523156.1 hypothetical protein [Lachnospiraceae bacterium]